jgi:hypothetical protein
MKVDSAQGERRQITVLFADMAGYTAVSERLGEEGAYELIQAIYTILADAVRELGGTVQDFTGDGIMALFGAPTGSYSPHNAINFGQNAWQLSPYLAVTWRVTQRWEISSRLTYDWSSRNNNPSPAYGAADIQAGDQMEINMSASYAVSDNWRLGVSGYALRQLGDARIDGSPVPGSAVHLVGAIIRSADDGPQS